MTSFVDSISILLSYGALLFPGLILLGACYWLARAVGDPLLRISVLILGFILIRDAMTPARLWEFGLIHQTVPWLRMSDDQVVLLAFGCGSLGFVLATVADVRVRELLWWGRVEFRTIVFGLLGGVLAAAPILALSATVPVEARGGAVLMNVLPALAFMAFAGNLAEEVLFRGYLQGRLEQDMSKVRAAFLSAFLFAACHSYLASTVTDVGWPLLAFTLWEGLICAFLRMRWGVIPAAIAHGLAIFLLSSGIV